MKLIDKASLVAEIEKRINFNEKLNAHSRLDECNAILSFIDTLEVKEISDEYDGFLGKELKMVDDEIERLEKLKVKEVDLEKETKKWWKEYLHLDTKNQLWMDAHQSIVFAKYFFELGMQISNKAQKGENI